MLGLLSIVLLGHFTNGILHDKHTNVASVKNSAVACEVTPFGSLPTPLLVRAANFVYPATAGQRTLTFPADGSVDLACPGGKLILGGTETSLQVATATCVSGTRFTINNSRYLWSQIRCSTDPLPTTRVTGRRCEGHGQEIEIGFQITTSRFARTMLVCFNDTSQSTIYTHYDLVPTINQQITGTPRPSWQQAPGIHTINNVNTQYTLSRQRSTINGLLGLSTTSTSIIQNNNYFLSRGHLTARSDFFYAAQQNSTFSFLNALPQWQTFNAFNWEQAENDVRDYAETNNVRLRVWTGGHGVATLPHAITGRQTELYLFVSGNQRALPVPEIFWKVVYNPVTERGVALMGVNNPYKTSAEIDRFCDDRSDLLTWLNWQKNSQAKGFSWACTVTAFRRIVESFPYIEIRGLLF